MDMLLPADQRPPGLMGITSLPALVSLVDQET